jgi:HEAT repeat protein
MLAFAEMLHAAVVPAIEFLGALLLGVLALLFLVRGLRQIAARRHASHLEQCRSLVDTWLVRGASDSVLEELVNVCHTPAARRAAGELLLAPLRSMTGEVRERSRRALDRLGFCDEWLTATRARQWWIAADAVRALGLVRERRAIPQLVECLDAGHSEIRAAALDALGQIVEITTLPVLARQLANPRHEHVRVIAALGAFGPRATSELVAWAQAEPHQRLTIAAALGEMGGAGGLDPLLEWMDDPDPRIRAASLAAIGDIGLDDRAYYFALRALRDADVDVRAMAARALGRSRRSEAAPYLAASLEDDWPVAAQSAAALKQLGGVGLAELIASAKRGLAGAQHARQTLWELQTGVETGVEL